MQENFQDAAKKPEIVLFKIPALLNNRNEPLTLAFPKSLVESGDTITVTIPYMSLFQDTFSPSTVVIQDGKVLASKITHLKKTSDALPVDMEGIKTKVEPQKIRMALPGVTDNLGNQVYADIPKKLLDETIARGGEFNFKFKDSSGKEQVISLKPNKKEEDPSSTPKGPSI